MKKLIVALLVLLAAATVSAEQMTINLRSGNRVVINYSGLIGGVYVQGYTDAIAGIQNIGRLQNQRQLSSALQPGAKGVAKQAEAKNKTVHSSKDRSSSVRIKWVKPIDDENLKNARSDSRIVNWFK